MYSSTLVAGLISLLPHDLNIRPGRPPSHHLPGTIFPDVNRCFGPNPDPIPPFLSEYIFNSEFKARISLTKSVYGVYLIRNDPNQPRRQESN